MQRGLIHLASHEIWHGGEYFKGPYSTEGWNRDANNIFIGDKRLDATDPETFKDLSFANYADNVYWQRKIITGADPKSFEILGMKYLNYFRPNVEHPNGHGPFARDKNHFYIYTEIEKRDGPWFRENSERPIHTLD